MSWIVSLYHSFHGQQAPLGPKNPTKHLDLEGAFTPAYATSVSGETRIIPTRKSNN